MLLLVTTLCLYYKFIVFYLNLFRVLMETCMYRNGNTYITNICNDCTHWGTCSGPSRARQGSVLSSYVQCAYANEP